MGGVCGVGFLREHLKASRNRFQVKIESRIKGDVAKVAEFLSDFRAAAPVDQTAMLRQLRHNSSPALHISEPVTGPKDQMSREVMVKRSLVLKIVAAWLITVPMSGILAAGVFFMIRGIMIP